MVRTPCMTVGAIVLLCSACAHAPDRTPPEPGMRFQPPGPGISPASVVVRTAAELASVLTANPFPDRAPNRTAVIFLDSPPPADLEVVAPDGEEVRAGKREVYLHYPRGMGRSKLKLAIGKEGTARKINTVTRLVAMTSPLMGGER